MTSSFAAALAAAALLLAWTPRALAQDLEPPPTAAPGTPGSPASPAEPPPRGTPGAPGTPSNEGAPPSSSDEESQDSGLGLEWVWLNADAGFGYANMESLSSTDLSIQKSSSSGPAFGVGAGIRLIFLTIGARARDLQLSAFNLWELDGEAAFHMRVWRIDPYFGVRGGYAFVGSMSSDSVQTATGSGGASDVSVHGFNVGPMVGLDIYFSKLLSLGADANLEFLFLKRPPAPLPAGIQASSLPPQEQALYQKSGSSVGLGFAGTAHLGIHF
jgi:hypothetical protein